MNRPRLRRILVVASLLLLAIVATTLALLVGLDIARNAAGMAAKGMCSAAFVAQRPLPGLREQEVLPVSPVLAPISVSVDAQARTVRARFAGLFERQAQWLPGRGCVLDTQSLVPTPAVAPSGNATDPQQAWPLGDASVATAAWGAGIDAPALQQVVRDAFVGAGDPQAANTRGIAVIHQGRALVVQTAPGFALSTPLHGWSMTKTVLAMLTVQLAQESGLALDTPVVDAFGAQRAPAWVAEWRKDGRSTITVADLLAMRDGLASREGYQPWSAVPRMLWGHRDSAAFAASAPTQAEPGTRWRYLSQTANLLAAVDRGRLDSDAEYWRYPAKALFGPIGATTAVLETDNAGNWVGSSYLWASVGDWARLGQLTLQDGRWGERQILPAGWLALASHPSMPTGAGRGYGAMTWRIADPDAGMCRGYGLPQDSIAMSGHGGQIVAMVPSRQAVIVRLGWTFRRHQFNGCAFVAAVLKTLAP